MATRLNGWRKKHLTQRHDDHFAGNTPHDRGNRNLRPVKAPQQKGYVQSGKAVAPPMPDRKL